MKAGASAFFFIACACFGATRPQAQLHTALHVISSLITVAALHRQENGFALAGK